MSVSAVSALHCIAMYLRSNNPNFYFAGMGMCFSFKYNNIDIILSGIPPSDLKILPHHQYIIDIVKLAILVSMSLIKCMYHIICNL